MAPDGDLSVTALYTAETWAWGGLPCAELFASREGRRVFDATNAALGVARLVRRDLAPLRASLLQRHALIDHLARGARQIVELGAGLSRRGAAFSADPAVAYTELDRPAVIARKRALLERTPRGRDVLARPNLRLIAGDALAEPLAPLVAPGPVTVIAEGLLMYLPADAQRALHARVRALGAGATDVRWIFDLVPGAEEPPPGATGRALGALMRRATGGADFARERRTRADLVADLRAAGFDEIEVIDAARVAARLGLPFAGAPTRTVVFTARARATAS